jgi:hypothetical protein
MASLEKRNRRKVQFRTMAEKEAPDSPCTY